jgi:hypothetical protein
MTDHKCSVCKDTGIMEYFEIDGTTIYRWQKPLKKPCTYCDTGAIEAEIDAAVETSKNLNPTNP